VNTQNEALTIGAARLSRPLPGWQPGQGPARMTAAAAPVMYGPDGMRLFLVAVPAAIIAALLAAASGVAESQWLAAVMLAAAAGAVVLGQAFWEGPGRS
jgi:hypothetical protein